MLAELQSDGPRVDLVPIDCDPEPRQLLECLPQVLSHLPVHLRLQLVIAALLLFLTRLQDVVVECVLRLLHGHVEVSAEVAVVEEPLHGRHTVHRVVVRLFHREHHSFERSFTVLRLLPVFQIPRCHLLDHELHVARLLQALP